MKKTKIYLNGNYYFVENKSKCRYEIYSLIGKKAKCVAFNDVAYQCVSEFDNERDCHDDIGNHFTESKFYNEIKKFYDEDGCFLELDEDSYNEQYEKYMNSLTPTEYFDIIRDGTYQILIDWNEIKEENDDNEN